MPSLERQERIAHLQRKLAARKDNPGYAQNCDEIRKQIANLETIERQEFDL